MDLNKFKAENFWLRAGLTIMIMIWLTSLAVINRGVITERKTLSDSLNYYKKINDSLQDDRDSLYNENFELNHANGLQELMIYNLSQDNPKYKNLEKDLEKEKNTNQYE